MNSQHTEQRVCNTGFWFSKGFVGHERRFPAIAGGDIRYIDGTFREVGESSFVRVFLIYINQLASTCQRSTYHRLALGRKSGIIIPTTSFCCWFAEQISSWVAGFPVIRVSYILLFARVLPREYTHFPSTHDLAQSESLKAHSSVPVKS